MTGVGESFFFADFVQVGAEHFPIDQLLEFGQEVVGLINLIELLFDVEEGRMARQHKDWKKRRQNRGIQSLPTLDDLSREQWEFLEVKRSFPLVLYLLPCAADSARMMPFTTHYSFRLPQ